MQSFRSWFRVNRFLFPFFCFPLSLASGKIGAGGEGILSSYDLSESGALTVELAAGLREVSGIAISNDGRLFAHNDEEGIVYEIERATGRTTKRLILGRKSAVLGDFEDIAVVKNRFFLVTSDGRLFVFQEGPDHGHVKYSTYKTGLSRHHNVEGLCFDPSTNSLLLACKGFPGEKFDGSRTVYSFSLETMKLNANPRFIISRKELKSKYGLEDFRPSAIARNPRSGTFLILSAHREQKGPAIIEVSSSGGVVGCTFLPGSIHRQPEGIAFDRDLTLYISDEGARKGKLTRYSFVKEKK